MTSKEQCERAIRIARLAGTMVDPPGDAAAVIELLIFAIMSCVVIQPVPSRAMRSAIDEMMRAFDRMPPALAEKGVS